MHLHKLHASFYLMRKSKKNLTTFLHYLYIELWWVLVIFLKNFYFILFWHMIVWPLTYKNIVKFYCGIEELYTVRDQIWLSLQKRNATPTRWSSGRGPAY